ncbi:unnamed protein product [Strongylus vulgaris]|uniref:CFA20 domain-containing protein n=1 Tax=Strongylus vulgaris TaxID=40348 RepID=A0A3P7J3M0_STRVU|nr:unnamed protein product [Strongylus vulgaris]
MFHNTFQSGLLSVLYSVGSNPLQLWEKQVSEYLILTSSVEFDTSNSKRATFFRKYVTEVMNGGH